MEVCGSCGTRAGEFVDDPDARVATVSVCRGCELLETKRAALGDREKSIKGLQVHLMRRG